MRYGSLEEFVREAGAVIGAGPAALIFVEDGVEVERTIRHHMALGFRAVVVFGPAAFQLPAELAGSVHYVPWDMGQDAATETAVNRVIAACRAPGSTTATTPSSCSTRSARAAPWARCWPSTPRSGGRRC
jgi:hypothetical protein